MNKQRKVLITITYNEMGIIIDTKAEEVAQPNLQPTCNKLATDCISRHAVSAWLDNIGHPEFADVVMDENRFPSAQPTEASCWGCNCPKMERLKEQKTFSEMIHLHDAETHDKRTETHACDLIDRQDAIEAYKAESEDL